MVLAPHLYLLLQNYQNLSKSAHISPQIRFTEDSLKIKKGLQLVSRTPFSHNFLIKNFSLAMLHKPDKFHHQTMFTSQVIQQNVFHVLCFHV